MYSQLPSRRVELSCFRLSEQSPVGSFWKLFLFIPDKNDWSGFQELPEGLSILAKDVLFFVLKVSLILGKTEPQLLLDTVSEWRIYICGWLH